MDPDLEEEIHIWFLETNGSAALMSNWFDISLREAKDLINKWENNEDDYPEDWSR